MKERLKKAMLSEGEAKKGLCSVKERIKEGDAQRRRGSGRSMLIEGEVESGRLSVKNRLEKGDAH